VLAVRRTKDALDQLDRRSFDPGCHSALRCPDPAIIMAHLGPYASGLRTGVLWGIFSIRPKGQRLPAGDLY
jgi:hypothetical protein